MSIFDPMRHIIPAHDDDSGLSRKENERLTSKVLSAQLDGECKAWDEARQRKFIIQSFEFWENCQEPRAKAQLQVSLGNWLRLGKREPASQIQAQQTTNNLSITMTEHQARAILRQLAGNQATAGASQGSEIIDIAPPEDNLARLKADIEAAQAQNQCHMDDINSSKINDVTNL